MRIISPLDIARWMQCPNKLKFMGVSYQRPNIECIFDAVVRDVFLFQMKYGRKAEWKKCRNWLNREINTLAQTSEEIEQGIALLPVLFKWFENLYSAAPLRAMASVPIRMMLETIQYQDVIPILYLEDRPYLCDIRFIPNITELHIHEMYRDPVVHIRLWGFWRRFGEGPLRYMRHYFSPIATEPRILMKSLESLRTMDSAMKYVIRGMVEEDFFPAVSSQCETCSVINQCTF